MLRFLVVCHPYIGHNSLKAIFSFPQEFTISKASSSDKMADKVKEVAAEEAERLKALTTEAIKSQAYLYPFKV